jgi:two-component system OmpR family sensor kinase
MRLSIGVKLFGGFMIVILVAGAIVLVAINSLSKLDALLTEVSREEIREIQNFREIEVLLSKIEGHLAHIIQNHDVDEHLSSLREREENIDKHIADHLILHPNFEEKPDLLFVKLINHLRSIKATTDEIVRLAREGLREDAQAVLSGPWNDLERASAQTLTALLSYENQEVEAKVGLAQTTNHSGRQTITYFAWVGVVLSLALAVAITVSLTRPIFKLADAAERVTRGDMSAKAEVVTQDEIGRLAEQFNEMLDRLNRSALDQRRFYADASHELRTPLTIIRGEAEVAVRGSESVSEYREALENIVAVADQMGLLVDELLFLARAEARQIRYENETVDLGSLLDEVVGRGEGLAGLKKIEVKLEKSGPVSVRGDRLRLRQLFFVVMDNAIKYSDPGGKVTLSLSAAGPWARVTVQDTGIGIPESDFPFLFERFFRGEAARSTGEGGTGLGLAIAKSIVEGHEGEIAVESAPPRGTTVSLALPRIDSEA